MHVVFDSRPGSAHFPGISRYATNLLEALSSEISTDERLTALATPEISLPSYVAVNTIREGVMTITQQWRLPRVLRKLNADVYHSLYFGMPYWPGVPTVVTVHDLIPLLFPKLVSPRARLLFPGMIRLALRAAQHIIAVSEATRKDLQRHLQVSPERITVIHHAPQVIFRPGSETDIEGLRSRLHLPEKYILYIGTNKPHKNLVRLFDAWALIAQSNNIEEWKLVLAGSWDTRYDNLRHLVTKLHLENRTIFLGHLSESDLPALYGGAGVFVFPSLYEGFGLPVIEAMACGVPVACSHTSSMPELGGNAAHYFDPYNPDDIAATLLALLRNPALRVDSATAALSRAQHFTWAATARRTLDVYHTVTQQAS